MVINTFNKLSEIYFLIKRGKLIKDSVLLGVTGGFLGAVAMALSNLLLYKAGKTEILYGHIAGSIFMRPYKTKRRKNYILGEIYHLLSRSAIGVLMVQIYKIFGTDLALLKGTILGMFTWESLFQCRSKVKIWTSNPPLTKSGTQQSGTLFLWRSNCLIPIKWLAFHSYFSEYASGKSTILIQTMLIIISIRNRNLRIHTKTLWLLPPSPRLVFDLSDLSIFRVFGSRRTEVRKQIYVPPQ